MKKSDGTKRTRIGGIPKLEDANNAGGRNGKRCTLILTEGDSAKALAVSGLAVVGRDDYGVFPLRGKLLNVREAAHEQIVKNVELQHLKQILGLKHGQDYTTIDSLRYGHLMIMTDQDHDGSHIKGLIINYLDHSYPSLLKIPDFLVEFITPIVKVSKNKQEISFYTMPQYEEWKLLNNGGRGWDAKYYKVSCNSIMQFTALTSRVWVLVHLPMLRNTSTISTSTDLLSRQSRTRIEH
jgi:DNA topoisomerase-2